MMFKILWQHHNMFVVFIFFTLFMKKHTTFIMDDVYSVKNKDTILKAKCFQQCVD